MKKVIIILGKSKIGKTILAKELDNEFPDIIFITSNTMVNAEFENCNVMTFHMTEKNKLILGNEIKKSAI